MTIGGSGRFLPTLAIGLGSVGSGRREAMTASTRDQKRGGDLRKEIVSQRTPASMEFVSQFMNETDTIELDSRCRCLPYD